MLAGRLGFLGLGLVAFAAIVGPVRAGDDPESASDSTEPPRRRASSSWRPSRPGVEALARLDPDRHVAPPPAQASEQPSPARRVARPRRAAEPPAADGIDGAARRFDEAMRRSRQIDQEVGEVRRQLNEARVDTVRNYDAQGYLQPSSRRVDGQKVFVLIGREGKPVAYLDIPPGIPTEPLVARRVGVRGPARFNEGLGTRLIRVRDLEPLDESGPVAVDSPSPGGRPVPAPPGRSDRNR